MQICGLLKRRDKVSVKMYIQGNNPFKKKKTAKSITWKDSDAPDAKGKFKTYHLVV